MRVTPSPLRGAVLAGRDRAGRALRVSAHPEVDRVVLSTWDGDRCVSTVRLDPADVADLVHALVAASVTTAQQGTGSAQGPTGVVAAS
jgi:hypothetical protein